ncbi:MAG: LpxL/LpxP family acyltransferase, partial [Acidimicrobiales bacterium]
MLPPPVARAVAEITWAGAAHLAAGPLARRREAVADNLRHLGDDGDGGAAEVFASYGRYWAESLRLPALGRRDIVAGVRVEGWHHIDDALAGGRGAVAALPHLGGWDWGGAYLAATGYRASAVVEALRPPDVLAWSVERRRRLGLDVIPVGADAGRRSLRALAANRILCLMADRVVPGVTGVEVELCGAQARIPAGPASLALRTGAPLLPV